MSPKHRGEPRFTSYYGRPILQEPTWQARDIAGYLFLGGLAGASSVLGAGAQATGRRRMARSSKLGAVGGIGLSAAALIHDLGRPGRFYNMLRVAKPTSPMSVGSWLLAIYGPLAAATAASEVTGRLRGVGNAAGVGAAGLGSGVAAYTAVLVADTAVPAWHESRRALPFVFVGSAAASAAGLALLTAPPDETGPARRAAVGGVVVELAAAAAMEQQAGLAGETFRDGTAGLLLRAAKALNAFGVITSATAARRSRSAAATAGLALLAGSALTRFGIFEAGRASTRDPKYTVVPQRARLDAMARDTTGDTPMTQTIRIDSAKDVVDFLKAQHKQIEALFAKVTSSMGSEREKAFFDLRRLLAVHETAEEEIVHPTAREKIPDGESIVSARLDEEHKAKELLAELERLDIESTEFETKFAQFQKDVITHAENEEHDEFNKLQTALDDDRLQRMRKAVQFAESMAPTRPHAGVESATANLLTGPFAMMMDKARDLISKPR